MYCYRKGKIVFDEVEQVTWLSRNSRPSVDAENTEDFGNVDYLFFGERGYELGGDWGRIIIRSGKPHIMWLE